MCCAYAASEEATLAPPLSARGGGGETQRVEHTQHDFGGGLLPLLRSVSSVLAREQHTTCNLRYRAKASVTQDTTHDMRHIRAEVSAPAKAAKKSAREQEDEAEKQSCGTRRAVMQRGARQTRAQHVVR